MPDSGNRSKADTFLAVTYGRLICSNRTSNSISVTQSSHCLKSVTGSLVGKYGLGDREENLETM